MIVGSSHFTLGYCKAYNYKANQGFVSFKETQKNVIIIFVIIRLPLTLNAGIKECVKMNLDKITITCFDDWQFLFLFEIKFKFK